MTEVLSGGSPDRPPRRWPRVAAALAVVIALGAGGLRLLDSSSPDAAPSPASSSAARPTAGRPTPAPVDALVRPRLDGVPGQVLDGIRLVVGGPHPTGIGRGAPRLGGVPVPADGLVTRVLAVPAGLLVQVQRRQLDAQPAAKIYLVRRDGRTTLLTATDEVVVGWRGEEIFALRYGTTGPESPGVLTELALSGRVLAIHSVPAGLAPQTDTAAGLVVAVYPAGGDAPANLQILDRRTLAIRQRLGKVGYVVGATSTQAAWTVPGCASTCELVVADLPTGPRRTIALAPGYGVGAVAFSFDGQRVAIGYYGRHPQQPGGAAPGIVEVVDLASGARHRVPGVNTGIKQVADLAWTPDGRWLAVAVAWSDLGFRRVGLWSARGGPIHVLPGRFPGADTPAALLAL